MVAEPFLIVVDIVESCCELVVGESVVREVLDDDVLQFMKLSRSVAMMLGEDFHIVVGLFLSPDERLDIREKRFLLIFHVQLDVVRILIIEAQNQYGEAIAFAKAHNTFSFRNLLEAAHSKTEVIVTFLIVLEEMKLGEIEIQQDGTFADIIITSNKYGEEFDEDEEKEVRAKMRDDIGEAKEVIRHE